MENVFFSEKGLTSTSANHICNLAKEFVQNLQIENKNIRFVTTKMSLINGDKERDFKIGTSNIDLYINNLKKINESNSLIAWLREALKEKDKLMNKTISLFEYFKLNSIDLQPPAEYQKYTFEAELSKLSIKERNRYFSLESECAVIGKFIHPDGDFSVARNNLQKALNDPISVDGKGNDTIIYTKTPSMDPEIVEKAYFELQNKHRSLQKELNSIKFQIQQKVDDENTKNLAQYNLDYDKYNSDYKNYMNKVKEINDKNRIDASKLKISIPNELLNTFEYFNNIGK